ncbi:heterokaryon incompatibility protein het-6 [Fusarium globosum]|uniref:Heterokaryon incompatibility protein het-6 n=1 Tax=Fusarium globosum TaxID=78864 RepID=A0A8H5YIL7_9HYPO|nr:heterokaryon incompatibility protein het-6 [Fusarium globosum]
MDQQGGITCSGKHTVEPTLYSSAALPHYQYPPLTSLGTVRILSLDPGQPESPLRGNLEEAPVNSLKDYEALSYVWADPGPSDRPHEIIICENNQDALLPLRGGSIFAALLQIRHPDQKRRVWADQCCINQDDLDERSNQVHSMGKIYENATRVLVWLGLDTNKEAESAFNLIHKLDEALSTDAQHSHVLMSRNLERQIRQHDKVLQALTSRPWFKRGWVVQEIGTETPATMIWGNHSIDWNTLASVCQKLKGYHQLRSTLGITTSDISFLHRRFIPPDKTTHHANRYNFVYELQRSRHLQFTDQRDRVFAFLSHFSTRSLPPLGCGPISIVVDYTVSVEQTYVSVVQRILQDRPEAACITLAAVQHPQNSLPSQCDDVKHMKLPSWVPDWRWSEGIILAEPICPHRAHGASTVKVNILENESMLQIYGIIIDAIEECSRPMLSSDFYGKASLVEHLWQDICRKTMFNLVDKYINGDSAFFALMQTLSNGCVQATGHECKQYDSVPEQTWLQMAAKFIVEAFGSSAVSDDIIEQAEKIQDEKEHDKWSRWATSASDGRVFARSKKGYYVLGPSALEAGDVVCVFFGCKVPFCLRRAGERYLLVGECYVHGLMKGEAMDMLTGGEVEEQIFSLI